MSTTNRSTIVFVCLLSLIFGSMMAIGWHAVRPVNAADNATTANVDRGALLSIQNAFTSIASDIKPAVVFITSEKTVTVPGTLNFDDFFDVFPFGREIPIPRGNQKQSQTSSGSGVIVRSDGYIITNDHVVADAERVTVRLDDGREFVGKVMRDPRNDLALVKIEATGLPTAKLGDSDDVKVGQWAIAIGSPFGLTNTLTVGVVSAVSRGARVPDRSMPGGARNYAELIQTDASINPGNSGGPLVDINGSVIGINSMIESPTGTNAGIGFAVPSNTVKYVMEQLIAHGKVTWGRIGCEIRDISPAAGKTLGITKGALVNAVEEDSPAEKAGIKPMDVIIQVNNKNTDDSLNLRRVVERIKPGTKVPVVVFRDGKRQTLEVTIGEASEQITSNDTGSKTKVGISVDDLVPELAKKYGLPSDTTGVLVRSVEAGSPASRAKPPISPGDVITKINNVTIQNAAQFDKVMSTLKSGDTALILILHNDPQTRRVRTTLSELTLD